MMDGIALACLAPWAPYPNLMAPANRAINSLQTHATERHVLSAVQAATNTDRL